MQSTLIDAISHLQRCSIELLGRCVIIQIESMLTDGFAALTTGLLIFFLLIEHGK